MAGKHNTRNEPLGRHTIDSLVRHISARQIELFKNWEFDDQASRRSGGVPTLSQPPARPTCIDLFCGAGGFSEGFRQAGFAVLAGNDIDRFAGDTFSSTHKDAVFIPGPIEAVSAPHLLGVTGLRKGELDCLIGGPPCQAFSVYNHQRGLHDERSRLFNDYYG
jgi:C-5 cytosine-specific DNA methylase